MSRPLDFPGTRITKDPETANWQNYLAWQAQTQQRRRLSQTQFNQYQYRHHERMISQAQYKEDAERECKYVKDAVERRLSTACECRDCSSRRKSRSDSDASSTQSSQTSSNRSSTISIASSSSSPPGTTVRGPTSPSSKNSLITSPPPRSRHHKRRVQTAG